MGPAGAKYVPQGGVLLCALALAVSAATSAWAQSSTKWPVTDQQRSTAQQVAGAGVALSELSPSAPDHYTVKRGDTLWRISGLFLTSPWRWPELWGMNLTDIANPHLIYPGQQLILERTGDKAILHAQQVSQGDEGSTVHVSPRNRVEALDASPLPTIDPSVIEPFMTESLIVNDNTFANTPRIVAVRSADHIIAGLGDRVYALGPRDNPVLLRDGQQQAFRVFRVAKPLVDPTNNKKLGMEAQYVGAVTLVRGQSKTALEGADGSPTSLPDQDLTMPEDASDSGSKTASRKTNLGIPATFRIDSSKQEIKPGDRLLPMPQRQWRSYPPHAPKSEIQAHIVKVFGEETVRYAGQYQIVVINKGIEDGIDTGTVLMVVSKGQKIKDTTNSNALVQLPDERNGLAMVFRPFKEASYALIMNITNPVQAGDLLVNPRH